MSSYTLQKAKSKYRNRIRLKRASQKHSSDTHKTPYNRVKRCRERKINIKAPESVNVDWTAFNRFDSPLSIALGTARPAPLGRPMEDGACRLPWTTTSLQQELQHSGVDKETYDTVKVLRSWRHYLIGKHFTLINEQKSVQFMFDNKQKDIFEQCTVAGRRPGMSVGGEEGYDKQRGTTCARRTSFRALSQVVHREAVKPVHTKCAFICVTVPLSLGLPFHVPYLHDTQLQGFHAPSWKAKSSSSSALRRTAQIAGSLQRPSTQAAILVSDSPSITLSSQCRIDSSLIDDCRIYIWLIDTRSAGDRTSISSLGSTLRRATIATSVSRRRLISERNIHWMVQYRGTADGHMGPTRRSPTSGRLARGFNSLDWWLRVSLCAIAYVHAEKETISSMPAERCAAGRM
ncbi:hypothetical protein PR048_018363 [Dryococelus australis]|uniref:Reverse transcriptase RNase H-like domain-containing protein n=1 Tax=Dryococelus australis TaxID=614101 RepID=A0ABQ9HC30_9NEOP|nr:hypothetical protein PR048_018363 [Dryococelus australis]